MSPILKGHQTHYCGLVLRMQIHLSFLRRLYKLVLKIAEIGYNESNS